MTEFSVPKVAELFLNVPAVLCVVAQILQKFQQQIILVLKTAV